MTRSRPPAGPHTTSGAPPPRAARTLVAGALVLVTTGVVLWWTGNALPGPDTYDHRGFVTWLTTTDPIVAAFAVVRLAGLVLITWTVASGALGLVVHHSALRRRRCLTGFVDRLCLPAVRRLVHTAAGVALATATLAPGTAQAAPTEPARQVATVVVLNDGRTPDARTSRATTTTTVTEQAVVVALDNGPVPTATAPTAPAPTADSPLAPTGSVADSSPGSGTADQPASTPPDGRPVDAHPDPTGAAPPTWQIRRGEHLWHVAATVLSGHLGRPATDREVAGYLVVIVEANHHRLVVPTDPDLVMVGQVFELPDPAIVVA